MHKLFSPQPADRLSSRKAAPRRRFKLVPFLALLIAGTWIASLSTASAQVMVTPTITFNGSSGLYSYSYSVVNGSSNTLAIVSFGAMPGPLTVQSPMAPFGFITTYDSGNGFISFLEDNNPGTPQTFAPGSTVRPFTFTSTFAPGTTTFQALDIFGNSFTGVTQAPVLGPVAVPEAGTTFALLAFALLAIALIVHRCRPVQPTTITVA
jgi:hypothetical protein